LAGRCRRLVGLRPVSRQQSLKRFAAALTSDHDAALSQHPRDGAAHPWMSGKRPIPIPHRPFKRYGQLITTAPPRDVNDIVALEVAEHDGAGCTPSARATQKRDDRDHRTPTL
jgi:hypothetical protein